MWSSSQGCAPRPSKEGDFSLHILDKLYLNPRPRDFLFRLGNICFFSPDTPKRGITYAVNKPHITLQEKSLVFRQNTLFSPLFKVQTEISEAINAPIFLPSAMQKYFFNFRKIASYFSPFQALNGLKHYLILEKVMQSMFFFLLLFSQMSSLPYEPPGCQEGSPASPPSEPEGQGGRGRGRQGPQGGRKAEASLQEAGVSKTSRWGKQAQLQRW